MGRVCKLGEAAPFSRGQCPEKHLMCEPSAISVVRACFHHKGGTDRRSALLHPLQQRDCYQAWDFQNTAQNEMAITFSLVNKMV